MSARVLIVDDDRIFSTILEKRFQKEQWLTTSAVTAKEGLEAATHNTFDVALIDIFLPDQSGVDLVAQIKNRLPNLPVIVVSSSEETQHIVAAMKNGASDYIVKPIEEDRMVMKVRDILELVIMKRTEAQLVNTASEHHFIGKSAAIRHLLREISKVAHSDAAILICGETGTGKNLVAETIHDIGLRSDHRFVSINCSAIPAMLLESELFGHQRGAFAGAHQDKQGLVEIAEGGTVFLDEIGDLPPELQAKLLRFLQGREFERLGGAETLNANVRIIAATNRNLEAAVHEGRFREDLFYRLNVLPIVLPPLRERKEDIPLLVDYFLKEFRRRAGKEFEGVTPEVIETLAKHSWPGNVRELQNAVERAVVFGKPPLLTPSDFSLPSYKTLQASSDESEPVKSLKDLEHQMLLHALREASGNVSKAARVLGISRGTIYRRLERYEIGLKKP